MLCRAEKPDELPDADDSGPQDDDNEIDVNKIDEELFNRVFHNILEEYLNQSNNLFFRILIWMSMKKMKLYLIWKL